MTFQFTTQTLAMAYNELARRRPAGGGTYETIEFTFSNAGVCESRVRYNHLYSNGSATTYKDFHRNRLNTNNDCNISTGFLSNSNCPCTSTSRISSSKLSNWSRS